MKKLIFLSMIPFLLYAETKKEADCDKKAKEMEKKVKEKEENLFDPKKTENIFAESNEGCSLDKEKPSLKK